MEVLLTAKGLSIIATVLGALGSWAGMFLTQRARSNTSTLAEWREFSGQLQTEVSRLQGLLDECQRRVVELAAGRSEEGDG